ncbi:hypothetical protein SMICM304S_07345 [Streptomyces microflavus]
MSALYIGTFGSFIGYSFAFGLVLQTQFSHAPLQAASLTFVGPLLGSLIRPVGGRLADRHGGARISSSPPSPRWEPPPGSSSSPPPPPPSPSSSSASPPCSS